jgi:surface polysaccharide O-acyltransferase-like enzyme
MISGALFLNLKKNITIERILKKYVLKLIIIFFSWSTVYVIIDLIYNLYFKDVNYSTKSIIYNILIGHYHLWFLYMMIGLYLMTPVIRKIVENKKLIEYCIILSLIFNFVPNMLCIFPEFNQLFNTIVIDKMNMYSFLGYVGYYILGHYLFTYDIKVKTRKLIYIFGLIGVIYGIISGIIYARCNGIEVLRDSSFQTPYNNLTLNIMIYSSAIFLFLKYNISRLNLLNKYKKQILFTGDSVLGIYLIHIILVDKLSYKVIFSNKYTSSSILLFSIIIFIVSLLLCRIIKKIPLLNKWII